MNFTKTKSDRGASKKKTRIITAICLVISLLLTGFTINNHNDPSYESQNVLSQNGSRGNEVRQIQTKLRELGFYNGSIDGIFGNNTKKAVIAFQKSRGLKADGIAGPKTLLYLGLDSGAQGGFTSNDVYLLAKVIEGEARGESYKGQVAVGAVILNRVDHASFPDSVSGVVYQSGAFDCVYDSNWRVEPSSTARKAASDAINGWDPTGGAIYYYNPSKTSNQWMRSRPVITVIGRHYFCS